VVGFRIAEALIADIISCGGHRARAVGSLIRDGWRRPGRSIDEPKRLMQIRMHSIIRDTQADATLVTLIQRLGMSVLGKLIESCSELFKLFGEALPKISYVRMIALLAITERA
jgi:hypothetical protein